jgi:PRTRC genetic system protein A
VYMHVVTPFFKAIVTEEEYHKGVGQEFVDLYIHLPNGDFLKRVRLKHGRSIIVKSTNPDRNYVPPEKTVALVPTISEFLPGGKIPRTLYYMLVSFFKKVMEGNPDTTVRTSNISHSYEAMAHIVWSPARGYRIAIPVQQVSAAHVGYGDKTDGWSHILSDEEMIVDVHSHNTMGAFFSGTDNSDDSNKISISGVIGQLNNAVPATVWRFNCMQDKVPMALEDVFAQETTAEVPKEWLDKVTYGSAYSGIGHPYVGGSDWDDYYRRRGHNNVLGFQNNNPFLRGGAGSVANVAKKREGIFAEVEDVLVDTFGLNTVVDASPAQKQAVNLYFSAAVGGLLPSWLAALKGSSNGDIHTPGDIVTEEVLPPKRSASEGFMPVYGNLAARYELIPPFMDTAFEDYYDWFRRRNFLKSAKGDVVVDKVFRVNYLKVSILQGQTCVILPEGTDGYDSIQNAMEFGVFDLPAFATWEITEHVVPALAYSHTKTEEPTAEELAFMKMLVLSTVPDVPEAVLACVYPVLDRLMVTCFESEEYCPVSVDILEEIASDFMVDTFDMPVDTLVKLLVHLARQEHDSYSVNNVTTPKKRGYGATVELSDAIQKAYEKLGNVAV